MVVLKNGLDASLGLLLLSIGANTNRRIRHFKLAIEMLLGGLLLATGCCWVRVVAGYVGIGG